MSLAGSFALAVSLSMDSFAASLGRSAAWRRDDALRVLRLGALFATFEVAALSAGWLLGQAALGIVSALDHWIAFFLLLAIGGRMIRDGLTRPPQGATETQPRPWLRIFGTALATSIDAAAVGMSMAFIGFDFMAAAITLAAVTFAMTCTGAALGRRVGPALGKRAELAGGVLLVAIGAKILVEHLYF